jgi:hypothetical protein
LENGIAPRIWSLRLSLSHYVYPKEERPVRDLLRKRSQLVHQHTSHLQCDVVKRKQTPR